MYIASAKIPELEGASHHSAFMGSRPTISQAFLALPTHWMRSPSRKSERGIGSRLHPIVFVIGVNQET